MADSVILQSERDLAVPLTWLCHPTSYSNSTRSGGRGAALGSAVPPAVQRHVRLQARSDSGPSISKTELELEQWGQQTINIGGCLQHGRLFIRNIHIFPI